MTPASEHPASRPPIRVLLVDDQTLVRQGVRSLLSLAQGIEVIAEAGDGRQAGEVLGLVLGLGDHRVDQHGEQRAGGEAVDQRLPVGGDRVGDRGAGDGRGGAARGHQDPDADDRAGRAAALRRVGSAGAGVNFRPAGPHGAGAAAPAAPSLSAR